MAFCSSDHPRNNSAFFQPQISFSSLSPRNSSAPSGIDCGVDCSETVVPGSSFILTATPDGSSQFDGWSGGGCSGTSTCAVTMDTRHIVTATFSPRVPEINIQGNGQNIADGDTTPETADYTDFGAANIASSTIPRTFTIQNTGTLDLTLSGVPLVAVSGTNASEF